MEEGATGRPGHRRIGRRRALPLIAKNATSVWKDSYVFVVGCDGEKAVGVAHPIHQKFDGHGPQALTFGPKPGEQLAADSCTEGQKPHGGWVEYAFPKPGGTHPERKLSYLLAVRGTPTWSAPASTNRQRRSRTWTGQRCSRSCATRGEARAATSRVPSVR